MTLHNFPSFRFKTSLDLEKSSAELTLCDFLVANKGLLLSDWPFDFYRFSFEFVDAIRVVFHACGPYLRFISYHDILRLTLLVGVSFCRDLALDLFVLLEQTQ